MANEHYPHIFLENRFTKKNFTSPPSWGENPTYPTRNRSEHSTALTKQLESAWQEDSQRLAVSYPDRNGIRLEFVSDPNFELALGSLEYRSSGIRLLNVRQQESDQGVRTLATVFVPLSKKKHFLDKIHAYAIDVTKITGVPKNQPLVDSISQIRLAVLESFWVDVRELMPGKDATWVEVWLSSDKENIETRFRTLLSEKGIASADGKIVFPERTVLAIKVNQAQLIDLIESSDDIAEVRKSKEVSPDLIALENTEQIEMVQGLLKRMEFDKSDDVVICILDSGVNNGHLLIAPVLKTEDLHTVEPAWGTHDHLGHGTLMAGIATYGDLRKALETSSKLRIEHKLESSKIFPPGNEKNDEELWGEITAQGISRAEIKSSSRKRIICMAMGSIDFRDRGRPSSWSGMIDKLSAGVDDDLKRLFIVSAGNIEDSAEWLHYPDSNFTSEVHDPGQSWNALTVGAFTEKMKDLQKDFPNYQHVAPIGGLSPFSTTSVVWESGWPIKPEVLFEGGNSIKGPNSSSIDWYELSLMSTSHNPTVSQFREFNKTSAATAQAARMAAIIQKKYPQAWPETIRGLIVHSANWTPGMIKQFGKASGKISRELLRSCGYGVPDLETALFCASNSLTLISQAELKPYKKKNNRIVTQDLHQYILPWPIEELNKLQETEVQMRVTLSYFIEPGPGQRGWKDRYRYPSFGLRFAVKSPEEPLDLFEKRVNKEERNGEGKPGTHGPNDNWVIGEQQRRVGSVHSDIWTGTASALASSGVVAIYPVMGWWKEREYLNCWNKSCRYSLIVSIRTPEQTIEPKIDIYSSVVNKIRTPISISV